MYIMKPIMENIKGVDFMLEKIKCYTQLVEAEKRLLQYKAMATVRRDTKMVEKVNEALRSVALTKGKILFDQKAANIYYSELLKKDLV